MKGQSLPMGLNKSGFGFASINISSCVNFAGTSPFFSLYSADISSSAWRPNSYSGRSVAWTLNTSKEWKLLKFWGWLHLLKDCTFRYDAGFVGCCLLPEHSNFAAHPAELSAQSCWMVQRCSVGVNADFPNTTKYEENKKIDAEAGVSANKTDYCVINDDWQVLLCISLYIVSKGNPASYTFKCKFEVLLATSTPL